MSSLGWSSVCRRLRDNPTVLMVRKIASTVLKGRGLSRAVASSSVVIPRSDSDEESAVILVFR